MSLKTWGIILWSTQTKRLEINTTNTSRVPKISLSSLQQATNSRRERQRWRRKQLNRRRSLRSSLRRNSSWIQPGREVYTIRLPDTKKSFRSQGQLSKVEESRGSRVCHIWVNRLVNRWSLKVIEKYLCLNIESRTTQWETIQMCKIRSRITRVWHDQPVKFNISTDRLLHLQLLFLSQKNNRRESSLRDSSSLQNNNIYLTEYIKKLQTQHIRENLLTHLGTSPSSCLNLVSRARTQLSNKNIFTNTNLLEPQEAFIRRRVEWFWTQEQFREETPMSSLWVAERREFSNNPNEAQNRSQCSPLKVCDQHSFTTLKDRI